MKARCSSRHSHAFSLIEILVIIAIVVIACFLIPALAKSPRRCSRIQCTNNLKHVGGDGDREGHSRLDTWPAPALTCVRDRVSEICGYFERGSLVWGRNFFHVRYCASGFLG